MRFLSILLAFAGVAALSPSIAFAAPTAQVNCIYETVPADRLADFGSSTLDIEKAAPPDLGPVYNLAENVCISQYSWSETDAANAAAYFFARVSREALGALFTENEFDVAKIDRAFASIKGQIADTADGVEKNQQIIVTALQKQAFPVDNKDVLDAVYTYVGLWTLEDEAVADFVAGKVAAK
jgi:hypothetical protein